MHFFSFTTRLTIGEIRERGRMYYETEQHSPWDLFTEYTDSRTGLHLYSTRNGYMGYYETGERNRTDSLFTAKAWIAIKIKENNGKRKIVGFTYFCPILMIALASGLLSIILSGDILTFAVAAVICSIFLVFTTKDETEMIECVKDLFSS